MLPTGTFLDTLPTALVELILLMNKPTVRSTIEDFLDSVDNGGETPSMPENQWRVTRFRLTMPTVFHNGLTIDFQYARGDLVCAFCTGEFVGCLQMKREDAIQKIEVQVHADLDSYIE
jgi:hypothetical protein